MLAEKTNMKLIYQRPDSLSKAATHYCPGCTHGVAHRLVAEVIDDMGLRKKPLALPQLAARYSLTNISIPII